MGNKRQSKLSYVQKSKLVQLYQEGDPFDLFEPTGTNLDQLGQFLTDMDQVGPGPTNLEQYVLLSECQNCWLIWGGTHQGQPK